MKCCHGLPKEECMDCWCVQCEPEPRLGLVAAIRARIAAGDYHQDTIEGDLATELTIDKMTEHLKGNDE